MADGAASPPSVSVVIPTHNHAAFLPAALDSVLAQTLPAAEVVVVDDGSTDDTPAALDPYLREVLLLRQPNRGVSAARNAGIAASSSALVAFLDADDVWLPDKLARQVGWFQADPGLGLVHVGMRRIDAEGEVLSIELNGQDGWVHQEMLLLRRPAILGGGSGFMVRRDVLDEIGGFDPDLSTSADWDLCYRVARRHRVGFVPEVLLEYRCHGANMHRRVEVMEHDMMAAFAKAFSDIPTSGGLKRRSYARLHRILGASYLEAHRPVLAARHLARAALLSPAELIPDLGRKGRS
ncbi:MAG: glycosyltransferase family 2 protein [Acidimicrobiales bacterium]